ncbi:NlpC/P60 family protein [Arthrobacter sp. H35-D1]|uniref:C40 family peptidase n=1 Tax=Arthrobacter sp. H35-D1 TaxID=3046202 RepID=UPI0024BAB1A3|nr:NlpC/P60 family protein [Arthrobacter sp. H35-D1]MDJ0312088.1 NlpC/P60 family protein [Arthrobacter sp. H35-D1]
MTVSRGKSRPYQLSMAVVCTVLASGGFVAAGYADTSMADAAALSFQESVRVSTAGAEAPPVGFEAFAAQGVGVKLSFANTLIQARKPAAKQIIDLTDTLDLTDPNGNTPHLARSVNAMRGSVPELSAELISQVRKDILSAAYQGLGHPYVWGGTSFEHGWDCSGFVQWAYAQAGVGLPRTEQWMPMVETANPQPGDIVVQNPDGPNHWSHIGIYIGNGKMISALNPSVGTFIHAPGDVSSSSTYFTMPGFASADAKAKDKAAKDKAAKDKPSLQPAGNISPSSKPGTKPATTKPGTTKPGTTNPGTTKPATKPTPVKPGTTTPGTTPATTPGTTQPSTPTVSPTPSVTPTASPTSSVAPTPKPTPSVTPTAEPGTTAPGTTPRATPASGTTPPAAKSAETTVPGD